MDQERSFRRIVILVVIVAFVLGCGTLPSMGLRPTETPIPPTSTPRPPATATPIPTATPLPTATPTETPLPSPTPTITPTEVPPVIETELDDGWYLYTLPQEGFSIALPPDWYSFSLTGEMVTAATDFLAEEADTPLGEYYQEMMPALMEQGIKFVGVEFSSESLASDYPASINILQQEMYAGMSLERLAEMSAVTLESTFDLPGTVEHEAVELTSGTAERLFYTMEVQNMAGEPVEAKLYQYMIESGGKLYIITIGTSADRFDSSIPTFERIVNSFQFDEQ